jgi:DNA-binding MarR family transcriptional regulator
MSTKPDHGVIDRMANECLAARIRILNRAITALYDDALRPLGVKVSQMNILVVTAKLGVAPPGRICDILHMDASTLSRNAERMVGQGWLEVVPDDDARLQPLRVTKAGMNLIRRAAPGWEKAQARARTLLGNSGAALLMASSRKLIESSTAD